MRCIIQRVTHVSVTIESVKRASIGLGLLILLGVEDADGPEDIEWLAGKVSRLRIFNNAEGVMNLSVMEVDGECLVVSQFTLHASTKKGNRPSYLKAAHPDRAIPMYENFVSALGELTGKKVQTGVFAADMKVELLNDGPVTIFIDSKARE